MNAHDIFQAVLAAFLAELRLKHPALAQILQLIIAETGLAVAPGVAARLDSQGIGVKERK